VLLASGALAWSLAPTAPSAAPLPSVTGTVDGWGPAYPVHFRTGGADGGEPLDRGESVGGLARSTRDGTTLLHVVTLADWGGRISYGRTADRGASWSQVRQFNRDRYYAEQAAVAASGKRVYVAWVKRTGIADVLYVMTNDAYGSSSHWSDHRRLGKLATILDYDRDWGRPAGRISIAASGASVIVTGRFHRDIVAWSSSDGGSHWVRRSVATTGVPAGRTVSTATGADGRLTAVAWTGSDSRVRVKVSTDGGRHWAASHVSGRAAPNIPSAGWPSSDFEQIGMSGLSIAVGRGRVVMAGSTPPELGAVHVWTQTCRRGTWDRVRNLPAPTGTVGAPVVLLRGRRQIGVAYQSAAQGGVAPGKTLWWQTSGDGGRSWRRPTDVWAFPGSAAGEPVIQYSAMWRSTGAVHVLASGIPASDAGSPQSPSLTFLLSGP
jgi:hypothetical protein